MRDAGLDDEPRVGALGSRCQSSSVTKGIKGCSSLHKQPGTCSGKAATMRDAGRDEEPCIDALGSRCQSSSVAKGMNGCSSLHEQSQKGPLAYWPVRCHKALLQSLAEVHGGVIDHQYVDLMQRGMSPDLACYAVQEMLLLLSLTCIVQCRVVLPQAWAGDASPGPCHHLWSALQRAFLLSRAARLRQALATQAPHPHCECRQPHCLTAGRGPLCRWAFG